MPWYIIDKMQMVYNYLAMGHANAMVAPILLKSKMELLGNFHKFFSPKTFIFVAIRSPQDLCI